MKTEFLAYDGWSLAGDVGGMVGMLLGMSILALYDTSRQFVKFACDALLSRKSSKSGET